MAEEKTDFYKPKTGHDIRHILNRTKTSSLGDILVEQNLISEKVRRAAEMERQVTNSRIGPVLVRNGLLHQKALIDTMLAHSPESLATERVSHSRIPVKTLQQERILLAAETATHLYVSTGEREAHARRIVSEYYPDKIIKFTPFDPHHMTEFLTRMQMQAGVIRSDDVREDERLDDLIFRAYDANASDIHIKPKKLSYSVFFRILGEMHLVYEGTLSEYRSVVAQIKNRAGMDIAEKRLMQDGVFNIDFASKVVDFRTVTIPTGGLEYVTMRILDPDAVRHNLDNLGISRVSHWRRGFNQMNGLCLVCGPTGSGKTTTLNATVSEIDRFAKAIFTVEDPVEYPISYAGQVNVNQTIGLTYSKVTRGFMRADPDIINIGEVRDEETALTMVRAAATGHLVLATLHASSIRGAISRLEYLNIPYADIMGITRAIMVQNLVKTLCKTCKGSGCPSCFETGYADRTIVSEVQSFKTPDEFKRMIDGEIFWPTLIEDAVDLLEREETDVRELNRIYGSVFQDEYRKRFGKDPDI